MSARRITPLVFALLVLAVVVSGRVSGHSGTFGRGESGGTPVAPGARMDARVLRVVDGDTVQVALGGRREKVRYIGIDTPEDVKPNTPVQCYSRKAAARNAQFVD